MSQEEQTKDIAEDTEKGTSDEPETKETIEATPKKRVPVTKIDGEAEIVLEESGAGAEKPETVFEFFEERVKLYEKVDALCVKRNGDWVRWTYGDYLRDVKKAAKGFIKLGLDRFHSVGILGFNAPEWFLSELGAIYAGGVGCGIYTTNSPEACKYVLNDSKANIVVCENDVQLQKILQIRSELPHLKAIVQYTGELKEKVEGVYTWEEMMKEGESIEDKDLDERKENLKPGNCCILVYTSGTTGNPKGVMISHDNITWTGKRTGDTAIGVGGEELRGKSCIVSYLPLSHVAGQIVDVFGSMSAGETVYFAQPDALKGSLKDTLAEVRPHFFVGVPRVYEKFQAAIQKKILESSSLRKFLFRWSTDKALRGNQNFEKGRSAPLGYGPAKFILKKIHKVLGLDRCTFTMSAAAPLSRESYEFFQSINIRLCDVYGMSECSGPHIVGKPTELRTGKCGKVFTPAVKTKFANPDEQGDGEICMYGRHVFMGYLGMEEKSREALDEEGWLHSGDIGNMDEDGYVTITGRIKELIITAGGENIAPVPIEDNIKAQLSFVSNVMLIGDKKKFLSCLITLKVVIDLDTAAATDDLQPVAQHALKQLGCKATKCSEIIESEDEHVFKKIQSAIDHYNEKDAVSRAQKIQKWSLLSGDFTIPGGELGPTLKLKRPHVVKKYHETIEAFYQDS